jgi:hypothetical protein
MPGLLIYPVRISRDNDLFGRIQQARGRSGILRQYQKSFAEPCVGHNLPVFSTDSGIRPDWDMKRAKLELASCSKEN